MEDIYESEFIDIRFSDWAIEKSSYVDGVDILAIYDDRTSKLVAVREIEGNRVLYFKYN